MPNSHTRVLLIEDSRTYVAVFQQLLAATTGPAIDVEVAVCLSDGLARLDRGGIDAVVTDLGLPDAKLLESVQAITSEFPAMPLLVLTGVENDSIGMDVVHLGAQDYLPKAEINGLLLERAIQYAIERKRADSELRELNEVLEDRVNERTMELARSNIELERFAYIIAHDLKAPARGIFSLATWLADDYADALDDAGRDSLQLMCDRARRMNSLIEGVLECARVDRNLTTLSEEDSDRLVRHVIAELEPSEHITVRIDGVLPIVVYDWSQLETVFRHLIDNGIRHMGKPRGEIVVSCSNSESDWKFCVRDNGVGIDPQHHRSIFDIFQTLQARDELETVGIGLTIVKRIVERQGGQVHVESAAGKGSACHFTVPLKLASQIQRPPQGETP